MSHIKVEIYFTKFSDVKTFDSNTLEHTPDWNEHKIIFCALFKVRFPPTNVSETLLFSACPSIDLDEANQGCRQMAATTCSFELVITLTQSFISTFNSNSKYYALLIQVRLLVLSDER